MIVGAHGIQIGAASIILIKTHTPVAMNAPVHFVIQEGTQVLVLVGALVESETTVIMPAHHGHVLEMAGSAFVTYRAIMGVVCHQPFDDACPEFYRLRSEEHTSELQSLMRISYAVFCLQKTTRH